MCLTSERCAGDAERLAPKHISHLVARLLSGANDDDDLTHHSLTSLVLTLATSFNPPTSVCCDWRIGTRKHQESITKASRKLLDCKEQKSPHAGGVEQRVQQDEN